MRGCLSVLLLAAVFVVAGSWFGGPALAGFAVRSALEGAGFEGRNTTIDVVAEPPIEVLGGTARRVVIGADDASIGDLQAGRLDVTLTEVDLVGRTFGMIDGRLARVLIHRANGATAAATAIELLGARDDVVATVHLGEAAVSALVAESLASRLGFSVGDVTLEPPDRLVLTAGPARLTARLLIEPGGGLSLALDAPGNPRALLLEATDPLTFSAVTVGEEVLLVGVLDVSGWLG